LKRTPETKYARVGSDYVAYQVVGDGPVDLVHISGWCGHVEAQWEYPRLARFLERLASVCRVICFDRRGHGLSDPIALDNITLEQWMEDLRAVMDDAGSERAALLASPEGGPMAILYAATYPERTSALMLSNTSAAMARHPDYPWGLPEHVGETFIDNFARSFWDPEAATIVGAYFTSNEQDREQLRRLFRYAISPGVARRLARITLETDVRHVLPTVRVPTLVLHSSGNALRRIDHGRYLAEEIAGARFVELPGIEQYPWTGDQDVVLDEIQEFLTGVRPAPEADRVLATVLFTDIVESTGRAAALGDKKWKELLDRHDALVDEELERHRGRKVNPTGDGVLATFDGPARAVRCAQALCSSVQTLGVEVRAGVHTGEVELRGDDIAGIAVHIGQRVTAMAAPGEVLVSRTVVDLVAGSGLDFFDRGEHELKGVPDRWQLYAVAT
jgi:class 3 adenylate cyclase